MIYGIPILYVFNSFSITLNDELQLKINKGTIPTNEVLDILNLKVDESLVLSIASYHIHPHEYLKEISITKKDDGYFIEAVGDFSPVDYRSRYDPPTTIDPAPVEERQTLLTGSRLKVFQKILDIASSGIF